MSMAAVAGGKLAGRAAVVTGAGRGIGLAIVTRLASEGAQVAALDLDQASDPHAALQAAIARPGPCLIHASIDAEQKVYPMVPPGAANRDMIGA